ncbi:MAG: PTS mannose transporter subunit IIAB, partial [Cardiobacterium sp.]
MIHLIVACHGRFAEELVNSAAMVFGEAEDVHAVTFMPGEGPEDLIRKYEAIMAEAGISDDVLFLVDLFGGSPYNAAIRVAAPTARADVLSGVNLPMLLELLDSRDDKSTVADLVKRAYTASLEGTKAFRKALPSAAAPAAAPAEAAAPLADRRAGRPMSGHMQIPLLRIDSRLIHGQVATSWAKAVKCDAIFAISDEVASDPLRSKLLLQVAPAHLQSYVITVDKAIKVWHNPMYADRKVLWLVTKPGDIVRL